MKAVFKKAIAFLTIYYACMLEYRAEIFLWALSGSLPIILMGVWIQAAQSGNFGLNARDFARYFFAVFLVRQFTNVWVIWEFERQVIEGQLSFRLLQPTDPVWHHVAQHLAEKFTRFYHSCSSVSTPKLSGSPAWEMPYFACWRPPLLLVSAFSSSTLFLCLPSGRNEPVPSSSFGFFFIFSSLV